MTGPLGFSRCFIPVGENSSGGQELGQMYSSQRVMDGDAFVVIA